MIGRSAGHDRHLDRQNTNRLCDRCLSLSRCPGMPVHMLAIAWFATNAFANDNEQPAGQLPTANGGHVQENGAAPSVTVAFPDSNFQQPRASLCPPDSIWFGRFCAPEVSLQAFFDMCIQSSPVLQIFPAFAGSCTDNTFCMPRRAGQTSGIVCLRSLFALGGDPRLNPPDDWQRSPFTSPAPREPGASSTVQPSGSAHAAGAANGAPIPAPGGVQLSLQASNDLLGAGVSAELLFRLSQSPADGSSPSSRPVRQRTRHSRRRGTAPIDAVCNDNTGIPAGSNANRRGRTRKALCSEASASQAPTPGPTLEVSTTPPSAAVIGAAGSPDLLAELRRAAEAVYRAQRTARTSRRGGGTRPPTPGGA